MAHSSAGTGGYQTLLSEDETSQAAFLEPADPLTGMEECLPHVVVTAGRPGRWNHIEDLDAFFRKVYQYHQKHGFLCMLVDSVSQLLQLLFVIVLVSFLFSCVDYAILFRDKPVGGHNVTEHVKVKLKDAVMSPGQCIAGFSVSLWFFLVVSLAFWAVRVVKIIFRLQQYLEVKHFYTTALHISPNELDNLTWHDVQRRLLEVQREHEMCVHKKEITELDVYHRILRHENYLVALVNKDIIPVKRYVPFIGTIAFFSSGFRYNLEAMLFWGPWAPFENSWHLKQDYKMPSRIPYLTEQLSRSMFYFGLFNVLLMPLIFLWQLLFVVFSYADIIKREPGYLGARMWSEYSRVHLRHFNELDHELNSRLCMGYKAATQYMNSFTSHITVVLAQSGIFFAGSFWVVLVGLTVWDEDFLAVEHIVTAIAFFSMTLAVCRAVIPDEHQVWCPEQLMRIILQHIHYIPDYWQGCAHTTTVREDFSTLFCYKFSHLLCEVVSPLVTPFLIMGPLRARSQLIVEFFCENTVTLPGVGDICSFALMDIEKHGNPEWTAAGVDVGELDYIRANNVAGMAAASVRTAATSEPRAGPAFGGDATVGTGQLTTLTDIIERNKNILAPDVSGDHCVPHPSKQAEMGKTELSLAHFKLTNPFWNPDSLMSQRFLRGLNAQLDTVAASAGAVAETAGSFDTRSQIIAGDGTRSGGDNSLVFPGFIPSIVTGPMLLQSMHSYTSLNPFLLSQPRSSLAESFADAAACGDPTSNAAETSAGPAVKAKEGSKTGTGNSLARSARANALVVTACARNMPLLQMSRLPNNNGSIGSASGWLLSSIPSPLSTAVVGTPSWPPLARGERVTGGESDVSSALVGGPVSPELNTALMSVSALLLHERRQAITSFRRSSSNPLAAGHYGGTLLRSPTLVGSSSSMEPLSRGTPQTISSSPAALLANIRECSQESTPLLARSRNLAERQ